MLLTVFPTRDKFLSYFSRGIITSVKGNVTCTFCSEFRGKVQQPRNTFASRLVTRNFENTNGRYNRSSSRRRVEAANALRDFRKKKWSAIARSDRNDERKRVFESLCVLRQRLTVARDSVSARLCVSPLIRLCASKPFCVCALLRKQNRLGELRSTPMISRTRKTLGIIKASEVVGGKR